MGSSRSSSEASISSEASSAASSESPRKPLSQARPLFKGVRPLLSLTDTSGAMTDAPGPLPATCGEVELSPEVPVEELVDPELLVALASSAASALGKSPVAVVWARSEETASSS